MYLPQHDLRMHNSYAYILDCELAERTQFFLVVSMCGTNASCGRSFLEHILKFNGLGYLSNDTASHLHEQLAGQVKRGALGRGVGCKYVLCRLSAFR